MEGFDLLYDLGAFPILDFSCDPGHAPLNFHETYYENSQEIYMSVAHTADQVESAPHYCGSRKPMPSKSPDNPAMTGLQMPFNTVEGDADPQQLRDKLMSEYSGRAETSKVFSKRVKDKVASPKVRRASRARRKHEARFACHFEGCNSDFTRRHNLNNHLKAHCGITDKICDICGKPFTTRSVLRRHLEACTSE